MNKTKIKRKPIKDRIDKLKKNKSNKKKNSIKT